MSFDFDDVDKNIKAWYDSYNHNYKLGRSDKEFTLLSQWNGRERLEMRNNMIPQLQSNLLYSTTKSVIGQFTELSPQLQLKPKDFVLTDNTDEDLINLQNKVNFMTDLLRSIAYDSQANIAYQDAYANMIYMGYGALRVTHDYVDSNSFNTAARVESIPEPDMAFFDPVAKNATKTDGEYCGIYTRIERSVFEKLYPEIPFPSSYPSVPTQGTFEWVARNTITVVDYYVKEHFKKTLVLLDNGVTKEQKDLEQYLADAEMQGFAIPLVIKKRKADDYKIMHYRLIRGHVLEKSEFPSKVLPIIFCPGDRFIINGREYTQSFVRHSIDPQRVVNYALVSLVQSLKNIRKEQYMISEKQLEGHVEQWINAEQVQGALVYAETNAPPPSKLPAGEASQSLYTLMQQAGRDIQATMGVFDANLGADTSEVSGVAIGKKQKYGNLSQVVFRENIFNAMEEVGRCILSMIPRIYDSNRSFNLLKQDGTQQPVMLNESDDYKIGKDEYDITVSAGLSFDDQKTDSLNLLLKLVSLAPQAMPLVADLFADLLDVENRAQLVERFRTLVPPNILAKESGNVQLEQQQQQIQQEQQQQQQMIQAQQMQQAQKAQELQQMKIMNDAKKLAIDEQDLQIKAQKVNVDMKEQLNKEEANKIDLIKAIVEEGMARGENKTRIIETAAEIFKTKASLKSDHLDTVNKLLDRKNM